MDDKAFDRPVTVSLTDGGRFRRIASTREAAECLATVWPLQRGPRHRDAVATCLEALDGNRSTSEARDALIAAARESRVLVGDRRHH